MGSTLTTFDFALKERYTKDTIEKLVLKDRVLWAKLTKDEGFVGDVMPIPVLHTNPQGTGGTFADAQANATNVKGVKFNITVGDYFGFVQIGDKVLKAARSDIGAFLDNKSAEIDQLIEQVADDLHTYLFSNGGYAIGRRASQSSTTVTLTNKDDIVNFDVGMQLVASSADGTSGSLRSGTATVTHVDREAGTFTYTGTITSFADNDYLFREGTWGGAQTVISGLGAWIPATAPSSTAFFGVDRSVEPQKLGGCRLSAAETVGSIEDRIRRLCSRMSGRFGGPGPTTVVVNPDRWEDLSIALDTKKVIQEEKIAGFGFEKLMISTGGKRVEIIADRKCPADVAYALHLPTWKLTSMDGVPHVLNGDGMQMLRKSDSNDYEFRLVAYPQLVCRAPGYSGRCTLPTT